MNTSLFEDLLTLIKKKSSIRNTEQAVELISLFIFLHYIKLYLYENDKRFSDIKNISSNNINEIKYYYQQLYESFIFSIDIKNINHDMLENLRSKIGFLINNINDHEIYRLFSFAYTFTYRILSICKFLSIFNS